ncbi:amino acid racemase [Lentisphaerota bacterium ZTH]|nr:amino acid racemase [Lentisphaerota bacterium]WET05929.1 amino acid racemase [Lentisphaerota bacterium ZTH]
MSRKQLTIGILGGMGPMATADLFQKIINHTPATRDQDHLRILIDNNPQIPDRTAALNGSGPSPAPELHKTAEGLIQSGADFIIVPCNTAHYFVHPLAKEFNVPVLSMIKTTADYVSEHFPKVKKVGLLATSGTIIAGVYNKVFQEKGIDVSAPSPEQQEELVMGAIYGPDGIKAGNIRKPRKKLAKAARILEKEGAEALLMACTEIPLALRQEDVDVPLLDPTDILAQAAVKKALQC